MARLLDVYLKERLVGRLKQDDSGVLSFGYDEAWLGSESAVPLSVSLPLRIEPFDRNECRPFFAGLLPEETNRKLIAQSFGVSDKNDFALLEKIGAECAGAVSLLPSGEPTVAGAPGYREIGLDELAGKMAVLPQHPLLAGQEGIRLSLAGAQDKMAVKIEDGRFFVPLDGAPSTHILKPRSPHFEGLVENEFFCMKLAAQIGFEVASVEAGTTGDITFLQVKRYDRIHPSDGLLTRVHQEDFCQAMRIAPELKYQQEGGPNLKRCFELLRAVSSFPGPDVLRLFDAVVFNFLIGNNDAHGKNFSLLYNEGQIRLAPFYDLVCTQAYPGLAAEMAMKIGDERNPDRIFPRNWRKFFKDAALSEATAEKRLKALAGQIRTAAQAMAGHPGSDQVAAIVIRNCNTLLSMNWSQ